MFEKFEHARLEATRKQSGTGLGLTFCKMAVEAGGGHIWIEDAPGGGTVFCFSLPVRRPARPSP